MKLVRVLTLVFALFSMATVASGVCVDHFEQPNMPYLEIGLWDYSPDICTSGDMIYLFDGDHLDCLNVADPTQCIPTNYQPGINLSPNPGRLMKIGTDHLYAFQPGYLSVIDISTNDAPLLISTIGTLFTGSTIPRYFGMVGNLACFYDDGQLKVIDTSYPSSPTLVSSIAFTGNAVPKYIGMMGDYAYYFDYDQLQILDFTDPATVTLSSSTSFTVPEYSEQFHFLYSDRVYLIFAFNPSVFVIVNVDDPAQPVVNYPDLEQPPYVDNFPSDVVDAYLVDDSMVLEFTDLPGNWEMCLDLSDPDNLDYCDYSWPPAPEATIGGAVEGDRVFYGTSGSYNYPPVYGSIHPATATPFSYTWRHPFYKPAISDNALIFSTKKDAYGWPGNVQGKIIILPRQCEYPTIISGSVNLDRDFTRPNSEAWNISWETDMWTSPELDKVVLRDQLPNPPGGHIGTVTLVGRGIIEKLPSGNYLHTVQFNYGQCTPRSSYTYDVSSTRTSNEVSSNGHLVKIKYCLGVIDPGLTPISLQTYPNPFNPSTTFSFTVPDGAESVSLDVYDLSGRLVKNMYSASQSEGLVTKTWQGLNRSGMRVSSGIYFAILRIDNESTTQKLVLLK